MRKQFDAVVIKVSRVLKSQYTVSQVKQFQVVECYFLGRHGTAVGARNL